MILIFTYILGMLTGTFYGDIVKLMRKKINESQD